MSRSISLACLLVVAQICRAQDIHYNPIGVAPTAINASYAGMFNGEVRGTAFYQNMWTSTSATPNITYGIGADMPVYVMSNGGYVAAGLQVVSDKASFDGAIYKNMAGLVSLAYHHTLRDAKTAHPSELAAGLQGGYVRKYGDLSTSYFITERREADYSFINTWNAPNHYMADVTRYTVNASLSFSQAICHKFSYTVGLNGANLNQPASQTKVTELKALALSPTYSASFGANWNLSRKISLRPAAYYELIKKPLINRTNNFVGGADVQFNFGSETKNTFFTNLFTGAWYHGGSRIASILGTELRGFRIAASIDGGFINYPAGNVGSIYTLQVGYTAPYGKSSHRRNVICDRF